MTKIYVISLIIIITSLFSPTVYAQETEAPKIIISEINWAGSSLSKADEWIELYNTTDQAVDVSGWVLTGSAPSGDALAIEEGTVINKKSTLLISNYPIESEKTTLNITPDLTTSSLSLSNSKLNIKLTTPEGIVVNEVNSTGKNIAGSTDPFTSMEYDLSSETWISASSSLNLTTSNQFGSPGKFQAFVQDVPVETDVINTTLDTSNSEVIPEDATTLNTTNNTTPSSDVSEEEIIKNNNDSTSTILEEINEVDENLADIPEDQNIQIIKPNNATKEETTETTELNNTKKEEDILTNDTDTKLDLEENKPLESTTTSEASTSESDVTGILNVSGNNSTDEINTTSDINLSKDMETDEVNLDSIEVLKENDALDKNIAEADALDAISSDNTDEQQKTKSEEEIVTKEEIIKSEEIPYKTVETEIENKDTKTEKDNAYTAIETKKSTLSNNTTSIPTTLSSNSQTLLTTTKQQPVSITSPTTTNKKTTSSQKETTEKLTSYKKGDVIFSEIVSNPKVGDEWVELKTKTSNINTKGWTLQDASGKKTKLKIEILSNNTFVIIKNPKGNLNNAGDSLTLYDATGNIIDSLKYGDTNPAPKKGESLALNKDGIWKLTSVITKQSENKIFYENISPKKSKQQNTVSDTLSVVTDKPISSTKEVSKTKPQTTNTKIVNSKKTIIKNDSDISSTPEIHNIVALAKKFPTKTQKKKSYKKVSKSTKTSTVTRSGVITAIPGTFGKQIAFMDSVQLYFYSANWPELNIGDMVLVEGVPSSNQGEDRLKISSADKIQIINSTKLTPIEIPLTDVKNQMGGSLIKITGQIFEKNGDKLTVKNNDEKLTIVANKRTGMSWSKIKSDTVLITGIVRHIGNETRLYPRTMNDVSWEEVKDENTKIKIMPAGTISSTPNKTPWTGILFLTFGITLLTYWLMKAKILSIQNKTT